MDFPTNEGILKSILFCFSEYFNDVIIIETEDLYRNCLIPVMENINLFC